MRIGVLGGSFDPVHRGHLDLARSAVRRLRLERLLVVPARRSPFKGARPVAARHRLAMLRLAFRGIPKARISPMELRRPAPSYTVDTLRALRRRHPKAEIVLLVGTDAARDFSKWHRASGIRRLASLAVFPRRIRVSSTGIRKGGAGLPAAVAAYARRHGLYGRG